MSSTPGRRLCIREHHHAIPRLCVVSDERPIGGRDRVTLIDRRLRFRGRPAHSAAFSRLEIKSVENESSAYSK